MAALDNLNQRVNYDVFPGLLGDEVKQAGLKTAVLGNADRAKSSDKAYHREAVLIGMDRTGTVDFGNVGSEMVEPHNTAAFGVRTDYRLLEKEFRRVFDLADLIVVETGDTYRTDLFGASISEELRDAYRADAVRRVGSFLKSVFPLFDQDSTLFVLAAPTPARTDKRRDELTPIVIWGPGFDGGMPVSATTRRAGLVTNPDIAPTVLDFFSIESPPSFIGRPIQRTVGSSDRLSHLSTLSSRSNKNDALQPPLIISYIGLVLGVFVLTAAKLIFSGRIKRVLSLILSGLLLYVLALPLSFFLLPLFVAASAPDAVYLSVTYLLGLGLVAGSMVFRKSMFGPLAFLVAVTALVIGIDLVTGSRLNMNTVFGYSPIVAGRFYGLGNQGLGIFLAVSILTAVLLIQWRGRFDTAAAIIVLAFFMLVTVIIGFPRWGADVGGTIASVVAFGTTYFSLLGRKISARAVVAALVLVVLTVGVFAGIDVFGAKDQESHLGRTIESIGSQGESAALQVIQRKIVTNLRILRFSTWSYFFWFIFGLILYLRYRPTGQFQRLLDRFPYVAAGISGAFVGGLIGFLVNDSGIVI
ncbi:MAG: hypothetical protein ACE5E0_00860, partial [Terriglobia bacterium]